MIRGKKAQTPLIALICFIIVVLIFGFLIYDFNANPSKNPFIHVNNTNLNYSRLYPDSDLTPGDVLTSNTSIICQAGYTKTVRDVPLSLRKEVYAEYDVPYPAPAGSFEVDHFLPLELGGSNDIKNLWLEPAPEFHEKDKVENYLHDQVCNHGMDIEEAQREIVTDWYAIYLQIK